MRERRWPSYKPREDPDEELHHFRRLDFFLDLRQIAIGVTQRAKALGGGGESWLDW